MARVQLNFTTPSKCQKQLAKQTDVNYMIQRALIGDRSGLRNGGRYLDTTNLPQDVHEYLNCMADAGRRFNSLPSEVRQKYPTPQLFLSALSDPTQKEFFESHGVFVRREAQSPMKVEVVNKLESKSEN